MTTATMTNLISSETFRRVLDRTEDVSDVVNTLKDHWQWNLTDRRPGPAVLYNGDIKPTDLDLACLLGTLAQRNALIIVPRYHAAGPKTETAGQTVIDPANRRGQLTSLSSNKEYFSFNMKFNDLNVLNSNGTLGAPRTFHVMGKDGNRHPGYDTIDFVPNAPENKFIEDNGISVGGVIPTKAFVAPQRWASFYGHYYFLTKAVLDHLQQEKDALSAVQKTLKDASKKTAPSSSKGGDDDNFIPEPKSNAWKSVQVTVPVMETRIIAPWAGDFRRLLKWNGEAVKTRLSTLRHEIEALQFHARITEYAFCKARHELAGFPGWMKSAAWEDHMEKQTHFRRLVYGDIMPGQKNKTEVGLMFRVREGKTQIDAAL